jgi:hypothetical protein
MYCFLNFSWVSSSVTIWNGIVLFSKKKINIKKVIRYSYFAVTFYSVFWVIKYTNHNARQRNAVFIIWWTSAIEDDKLLLWHNSEIQKPHHHSKGQLTFSLGCGATGGLARGKAMLGAWGVGIRWPSFVGVSTSSEIRCFGASVTHVLPGSQTAEGKKILQGDTIQIRLNKF